LALGYYDGIIGQYWLELHKDKVDYYEKKIECVDDKGVIRSIKGEKTPIVVRKISTMQAKNSVCKGCKGYSFMSLKP
jgi:hypothetical protein